MKNMTLLGVLGLWLHTGLLVELAVADDTCGVEYREVLRLQRLQSGYIRRQALLQRQYDSWATRFARETQRLDQQQRVYELRLAQTEAEANHYEQWFQSNCPVYQLYVCTSFQSQQSRFQERIQSAQNQYQQWLNRRRYREAQMLSQLRRFQLRVEEANFFVDSTGEALFQAQDCFDSCLGGATYYGVNDPYNYSGQDIYGTNNGNYYYSFN